MHDQETCTHLHFDGKLTVNRLEDTGQFQMDVRISCLDCGLPFRFLGLPMGLNLNGAAMSVDGLEARLAIWPGDGSPVIPGSLGGFSIKPGKGN